MQLSRLALAVTVAASSLLLSGTAAAQDAPQGTTQPGVRGISVLGRAFNPSIYRVAPGTQIRWMNGDRVAHNLTTVGETPVSFSFALPARQSGRAPCVDTATGQINCPTFTSPPLPAGRYAYVCTIHKRMAGTLIVTDGRSTVVPTPRVATPTPPPTTAPQARRAVSILGQKLSPKIIRVPQGGQLWFANGSSEQHWLATVSPEGAVIDPANPPPSFDTGPIPGRPAGTADPASFPRSGAITIPANTRPGRYGYVCLIHPNMSGMLQIDPAEPEASTL